MRKITIILPTYNEAGNIEKIIAQIFKVVNNIPNWETHVLIVDSRSKDNTGKIVRELQKQYQKLHIIETEKEGLGKAYINGFKYAINNLNPYLIFEMDADLSHDPEKIPLFVKEIENGADFVIGSRYIKNGSIPENWGIHRKIFSVIGNLIIRAGFMNLKITDWTGGYRAIKIWVVKNSLSHIKNYSGYVFQVAFLDSALKQNAIIKEIPINFRDRIVGVSKINAIQYILNILLYVIVNSSFIKYFIVGAIGFMVDFGISSFLVKTIGITIFVGNMISMEMAIISNFILNNFWSFKHKKITRGLPNFISGFLKFNLASIGGMVIQLSSISILIKLFGTGLWQIYKVLVIIFLIIPYSYFIYNKFIWKSK